MWSRHNVENVRPILECQAMHRHLHDRLRALLLLLLTSLPDPSQALLELFLYTV